jgi:hypothetical protein
MTPQWTPAMLRLTLRGGSVYYLQDRRLSSPEPHYFVVLNVDPACDACLVLVVASSKIDNVRRRRLDMPPDTLVEIPPSDYAEFSVQSIVDCNTLFSVTRQELLQKLQAGVAAEMAAMPAGLLARLRQGVLASPLIEESTKDILR